MAKMTPEAKKARDAQTVKMEDTLEKVLQNPQGRNNAINKSAAASLAGPSPARGFINTSKGEEFLREEKGQ